MIINERGFSHIFVNEYVAEAVGRCGEFVNRWLKRNGNIFGADGAFGAELVTLDHLLNCCLFYHPGFVHNLSAKN
jgi:hypothetical protein